jgi:hypothetical protein
MAKKPFDNLFHYGTKLNSMLLHYWLFFSARILSGVSKFGSPVAENRKEFNQVIVNA